MDRVKKLEKIVEHLWDLEKKINTLIITLKDIKDNDLFAFRMEIQQTIKDEQALFSSRTKFVDRDIPEGL